MAAARPVAYRHVLAPSHTARPMDYRDYLIRQGLSEGSITAVGFGKEFPVADNRTAAGRQKNRRVELIVSGEVIGVKIGR